VSTLENLRDNLSKKLMKPYIQMGMIVFLVSILSFGVGFLLARDSNPAPIVIEQNSSE